MGGVRLPRRCSGPLRAAVLLRTPPFRGAVAAAVRQQQQQRRQRRRQQQHPVRGWAGGAVARGGAAGPAQRGQGAPSRTVTPSPAVPALRGARCPQSTLLNALVGQKVSIATSKAQTTRRETLGVLTTGNVQLVPRRAHIRPRPHPLSSRRPAGILRHTGHPAPDQDAPAVRANPPCPRRSPG